MSADPLTLILASEFPPGPGGIGTHAHQLALQLHGRGWQVSVAAPLENTDEQAIGAFCRAQPFAVHRLRQLPTSASKLIYRFARVAQLIRHEHPSLLVASGERMVWLAAMLHARYRIPFVVVSHAMEVNVPARWQREITRRSYMRARAVICVSEYTCSRMTAGGIHPHRTAVIPNGADEGRFSVLPAEEALAFRRAHGLERTTLLVTVGSVHERKGQDVVIKALPALRETIPDIHYAMVGIPYRRDDFQALAGRLGVADRVHFLGVLPEREVVRALNAADLFVMASQHTSNGDFEGFGIAVVEAALCGRPAVVSDGSGVVEAIEPGETGLVATVSDPASTAAQIGRLLSDRPLLAQMGQRARDRALREKTWSRRGASYDTLLRQLL